MGVTLVYTVIPIDLHLAYVPGQQQATTSLSYLSNSSRCTASSRRYPSYVHAPYVYIFQGPGVQTARSTTCNSNDRNNSSKTVYYHPLMKCIPERW